MIVQKIIKEKKSRKKHDVLCVCVRCYFNLVGSSRDKWGLSFFGFAGLLGKSKEKIVDQEKKIIVTCSSSLFYYYF